MPIHYPNGNPYTSTPQTPRSRTMPVRRGVVYGGRGMTLEEELNVSNAIYREDGRAVVYKKPTPIQIVKVDYPTRAQAVIREAYFKQASTTDYNGIYQGYYLDFEAKETKNKASFPLKNFHQHQIDHMRACLAQGGICFVVIRFANLHRLFVYPATPLITAWDKQDAGGRKSIPLTVLEKQGIELFPKGHLMVPYLDGVDVLIQKKVGSSIGK